MKWPSRPMGEVAARATLILNKKVTERTARLALAIKWRSESQGQSLTDVANFLGYSRGYVRSIARTFGISFSDYTHSNPNPIELD